MRYTPEFGTFLVRWSEPLHQIGVVCISCGHVQFGATDDIRLVQAASPETYYLLDFLNFVRNTFMMRSSCNFLGARDLVNGAFGMTTTSSIAERISQQVEFEPKATGQVYIPLRSPRMPSRSPASSARQSFEALSQAFSNFCHGVPMLSITGSRKPAFQSQSGCVGVECLPRRLHHAWYVPDFAFC